MTISSPFSLRSMAFTGMIGAIGVASVAISAPAFAATVDFSTSPWSRSGNVSGLAPGAATLSTASPATDALAPTLQSFLGVAPDALDSNLGDQAYEGSALKATFAAGDTLSFNWSFSTLDSANPDSAFVVLPGLGKVSLSGASGTYSTTFTSAGLFGIGIVDVGDSAGDSTFTISNAQATPVPAPVAAPAALVALAGMGYKKLRQRKAR
jgi:hypothetical protein